MFERVGDEILQVEQVDTGVQVAVVKTHHCLAAKLVISGDNVAVANTASPFIIEYRDWQNAPSPDENRPIRITVTGPGRTQELILTPVNGQAEFDFVSEVPGTFTVRAAAEFPCDPAEIEVVVT